ETTTSCSSVSCYRHWYMCTRKELFTEISSHSIFSLIVIPRTDDLQRRSFCSAILDCLAETRTITKEPIKMIFFYQRKIVLEIRVRISMQLRSK
ncbi:hypothetical protein PMAYCL1PPCAC_00617, partial [Pristionchus mayeri]